MSFSVETHFRVYDDTDGHYITVRPDADGLGLVSINGGSKFGDEIRLPTEMASKLANLIRDCVRMMDHDRERNGDE